MKKFYVLMTLIIALCLTTAVPAAGKQAYITRAQFIKEVLIQSDIEIEDIAQSSFSDVTDPEFIPYIETAYINKIVSGYGDCFCPGKSITKEEAVKVIVEVFGDRAGFRKTAGGFAESDLGFIDSQIISQWAVPYISYALDIGLITVDDDAFGPQAAITVEQAGEMVASAKAVYQQLFTRDGLSAPDMLVLIIEKNLETSTYKQRGSLLTNMEFIVDGVTPEQIEENEQLKALFDEGMTMNMQMDMDMSIENPDRAYIRQTLTANTDAEDAVQEVETFMDGHKMYTRTSESEKWIMQDLGPVMEQLEAVSGKEPYQMATLSEDELRMFKEYARYEDDIEIDGLEYYVIGFDIDKDTYREYYLDILEKVMGSIATLQMENPQLQQDPSFDPDQFKQMMLALVSGMEVELSYKYYINKETKMYERIWLSQQIEMPMEQFMAQAAAVSGEEIPEFSIRMLTSSEGEFEIYDINGDVEFPQITEEDIMDASEQMPTNDQGSIESTPNTDSI